MCNLGPSDCYRTSFGLLEVEITRTHECYFPEAGEIPKGSLEKRICKKNPGHKKFIPITKLSKENLPSDWQRNSMFNLIKSFAPLTVRIQVNCTSANRPKTFFLSPKMKPGKNVTFYGTGYVYEEPRRIDPCFCGQCREGTLGYEIYVKTAGHVVCDNTEVLNSVIEFYADDPDDNSSIVLLKGFRVLESSVDKDSCRFVCITHDENVYKRIKAEFEMMKKVLDSFREVLGETPIPYFYIISHPHGHSKHVSFGDIYEFVKIVENGGVYEYNIPTCPGSSGAHVSNGKTWSNPMYEKLYGPHHGVNPLSGGRNRSGVTYFPLLRLKGYI